MLYTYLLKCIPTNQFYYGVSYKKDAHPSQFWNTYFTSSASVHKLIDKFGVDNFVFEIRKTFTDINTARQWETTVLKRLKVVGDPKWINKHNNISFEPKFDDNHMKNDKSKKALIATLDQNAVRKGFNSYSDYFSVHNPAKNSDSAKKIGEWKKGKKWISHTHLNVEKMVSVDDYESHINEGWVPGKTLTKASMMGKNKGKIYINNGLTVKAVSVNDAEMLLNNGWVKGRIK